MFTKVLVPLDRSSLAEQALGAASAIARASHAGIDVVLVHQPMPFAGFGDAPWNAEQVSDEDSYLESIVSELASGASVPATHALLRGETVEMICARAHDVDADLIVMTSHGRTGLSRAWIGSVADGVLRQSAIPVLMLRPVEGKADRAAAHHLFKRVCVPLDGSAHAMEVLASAAALARCHASEGGARLTLLRVVQPVPLLLPDMGVPFVYPPPVEDSQATERLIEEAKQQLGDIGHTEAEQGGVVVDTHVVLAPHVAQAILDFARGNGVDVIAMSTHGRGASRLFVGSVADKVLRASGLPVMLYRPLGVGADAVPVQRPTTAQTVPILSPA